MNKFIFMRQVNFYKNSIFHLTNSLKNPKQYQRIMPSARRIIETSEGKYSFKDFEDIPYLTKTLILERIKQMKNRITEPFQLNQVNNEGLSLNQVKISSLNQSNESGKGKKGDDQILVQQTIYSKIKINNLMNTLNMDKKSIFNNGNQEKIKSFLNKIAVSLFNNKTQYDAEIDIDFNVDYKTNKINKKDSLYISIGRPRNEIIITNEGEIENILISTLTFSFNPINLPEESAAKGVDDIKTIIEEPLLLNI